MVTTWDNLLGTYSPLSEALQSNGSPLSTLNTGRFLPLFAVDFAKNFFYIITISWEVFMGLLVVLAFFMVFFNLLYPLVKGLGRWRKA